MTPIVSPCLTPSNTHADEERSDSYDHDNTAESDEKRGVEP